MTRRRSRGYMIFFLLVMIPGLLLGLALSADASRMIMASHRAGTVADNVVMAGATGIDSSNQYLDTGVSGIAVSRANDTFRMAKKTGMLPSAMNASLTIVELLPNKITVRVSYEVRDLMIIGFLSGRYEATGTSTRSAGPCSSGTDAESCSYLG